MNLIDKLPEMTDEGVNNLLANAKRLEQTGTPQQQAAVAEALPAIEAEAACCCGVPVCSSRRALASRLLTPSSVISGSFSMRFMRNGLSAKQASRRASRSPRQSFSTGCSTLALWEEIRQRINIFVLREPGADSRNP